MLRRRVITSIIGLPVFIAAIWLGNPWFIVMVIAIVIIAGLEFHRIIFGNSLISLNYFSIFISVLLVICPLPEINISRIHIISAAIVISLIWTLFILPRERAFFFWVWSVAGMIFIGWTLSYWVDLRVLEFGKGLIFWIAFIVITNDTAAYFIGRAIGKRHLVPAISPNKTLEGAIGGLITGIVISILIGVLFIRFPVSWQLAIPINYWQMILVGCIAGIASQAGDLIESLLKRNFGVKDSGKLLPGHGGILDRIDSFIITGLMAWYLVNFLI